MTTRRMMGVALLLLFASGCERAPDVEITERRVPRVNVMQRFLGAIVMPPEEASDKIWYVTVAGPELKIASHQDDFERFVRSIKIEKDEKPSWKVPAGWNEEPAKDLRAGTFFLGPKKDGLELSVVPLARQAKPPMVDEATWNTIVVSQNINRWRKQIGLKVMAEGDLEDFYRGERIGPLNVVWVDMLGPKPRETPKGPFNDFSRQPPAVRPPAQAAPFEYEVPEGWKEAPPAPLSVLTLEVADKMGSTKLTVSLAGGDLLANVNRWRMQVGLGPWDQAAMAGSKDYRKIEVDKLPAHWVNLAGQAKSIQGAIVPDDDQSWFFKLTGTPEVVAKNQEKFENFLKSVKFKK